MNVGINDRSRAQEIKEGRRIAGLSQQALAERAKCSISTVALLERGYAPSKSGALKRVLVVLAKKAGE